MSDEKINFKPLSEGLGLNHFSDGLPYTPIIKKKKMVQFSVSPPRAPRSISKITPPEAPKVERVEPRSFVTEQIKPEIEFTIASTPAPLLLRAFAFFVDVAAAIVTCGFVLYLAFLLNGVSLVTFLIESHEKTLFLMFPLFGFSYFLLLGFFWKKTFGMAILNMKFNSSSALSLILRAVIFPLSVLPLGLGLLLGFFDSRNRCWHDKFSNTEVVLVK